MIYISRSIDYHIIVCTLSIIAAWKWGDWRNWRLYYPTILYLIISDLIYRIITYNYPLWTYESPLLKTQLSGLLIDFTFFPATVLLFVPYFTNSLWQMFNYTVAWVAIYTIWEGIAHHLSYLSYHHGWSIYWSIIVDIILFPSLYIHFRRPIAAWLIYFITAIAIITIFRIPLVN